MVSDFKIWEGALRSITSANLRMPIPLGKFLRRPFDKFVFLADESRSVITREDNNGDRCFYHPVRGHYRTRSQKVFELGAQPVELTVPTHYVSVQYHTDTLLSVSSQAKLPRVTATSIPSLREALNDYGTPSLWRHFDFGPDEEWLVTALRQGSLIAVHDGSFMPDRSEEVCSAAVVFFCMKTGKMATVTVAERTSAKVASNYRGELLGALLLTLILRAASLDDTVTYPDMVAYCDNKGVVIHGNNCTRSLSEKQAQADLVGTFRRVSSRLPFCLKYVHVYGHCDRGRAYKDLSLPEQLNVIADQLARDALLAALRTNRFISSCFPLEQVRIFVDGTKITSSVKQAISASWGRQVARDLYQEKKIVSTHNFDLIYHEGVGLAVRSFPPTFRVWLTRFASGFCGNNRMLSRYTAGVNNVCPCCLHRDESNAHITRCRDKGRRKMFKESVGQLLAWLDETFMDEDIISAFRHYLRSYGEGSMVQLLSGRAEFLAYAMDHDTLGWDNFLEGRVATSLIRLQTGFLHRAGSRMQIRTWAKKFVQLLLNITHRQWLYRNARIHLRAVEGKTEQEHLQVIRAVRNMMLVDPATLLPEHRKLLELDFLRLGEGSTVDRQYWLAQMQTAVDVAELSRKKRKLDVYAAQGQALLANTVHQSAGIPKTKQSNLAKRARK